MTIISSITLLRTISIFHLTTAYYLLTSPQKIADQNLVFILGAAMAIPEAPPSLSLPSPALALASLFLILLSISDLTATNLDEEVASYYWSSQAPVRLMFFFAVTAYSYVYKPDGIMGPKGMDTGVGDLVCNSMVFTWGFVEVMAWFWIYVKLREERREMMVRKEFRRKAEEDRL